MIISLGPKKVENQSFQIKNTFPLTKDFGRFSLVLSSVTNFKGQFVRIQKFFHTYCGRYKIIYVTPKKLLKTQNFEEKGNCFSDKII